MKVVHKIFSSWPTVSFRSLSNVPLLSSNTYATSAVSQKKIKPTVVFLPGDGVWPELFDHLRNLFKTSGIDLNIIEKNLSELPGVKSDNFDEIINCFKENKVGIKGIIATPLTGPHLRTVNMKLRRKLDLFANVMRVRSFDGFKTRHDNVDFVVIREQTEGEYSSLEHESVPGVVECLKIITRVKSERIAKFAFDYAKKNNRKKVTVVHKANIMKLGDGLFLESCRRVSEIYPGIELDNIIIDNCCMQLVSRPQQFDVLVTPNLYGAIVDNVAAGLIGGAGLVPGESFSHDVAVFEPGTRHAFAVAAGKDIANPIAIILTAVGMLRHLNMYGEADRLEASVLAVIKEGRARTRDMGGTTSTSEMVAAIAARMS